MRKLLYGLCTMALCTTLANANFVPLGTLADLKADPDGVVVGDKIFDDFDFGSTNSAVTAAGINVSVEVVGTSYYLRFQGLLYATGLTPQDYGIFYSVATVSGAPLLIGIDQSFNLSGGAGAISIGETVFDGSPFGNLVAQSTIKFDLPVQDQTDPPAEPLQGDSLTINPALSKVWVTKDILIVPEGELIAATIITQSFHQIPEPMTMLLLGSGLVGLGLLRRKKNV